jgi:hypothetical protein
MTTLEYQEYFAREYAAWSQERWAVGLQCAHDLHALETTPAALVDLGTILVRLIPYRNASHMLWTFWRYALDKVKHLPIAQQISIWRVVLEAQDTENPVLMDYPRADRVLTTWQEVVNVVATTPLTASQIHALVAAFDVPMPLDGAWFQLAMAIDVWCFQYLPDHEPRFLQDLMDRHNASVRRGE